MQKKKGGGGKRRAAAAQQEVLKLTTKKKEPKYHIYIFSPILLSAAYGRYWISSCAITPSLSFYVCKPLYALTASAITIMTCRGCCFRHKHQLVLHFFIQQHGWNRKLGKSSWKGRAVRDGDVIVISRIDFNRCEGEDLHFWVCSENGRKRWGSWRPLF